jgi:hypothetical protein
MRADCAVHPHTDQPPKRLPAIIVLDSHLDSHGF